MQRAKCYPLTFDTDSTALFGRLRSLGKGVFLDSSDSERGRFDILSAAPTAVISGNSISEHDILRLARSLPDLDATPDIPFCGGLIGWLGYEWGAARHGIDTRGPQTDELPQCYIGVFEWAVVVDHKKRTTTLAYLPTIAKHTLAKVLACLEASVDSETSPPPSFTLEQPIHSDTDEATYTSQFNTIKEYLHAGDCYQVNLGRRFSTCYTGDSWTAYQRVRKRALAPWSAFFECPEGELMSFSPERLLKLEDRTATTEPIKGTAPRHQDADKDRALANALAASKKNRAENLMIVDLLRNDLGQVAVPGSVQVEKLFELQSFNTVHHLVSNISAELAQPHKALDLLLACFPGGSITGAPKHRAMQIIAELEPVNRSVYCGSLFYLSADGNMDSNILIRSMSCVEGKLLAWSGGGIVADSTAVKESAETHFKIDMLLAALSDHQT